MADSKISALTDGVAAQSGDEFVVARSGSDLKLSADELGLVAPFKKLFGSVLGANTASVDTGASAIPSGFSTLLVVAKVRSTFNGNDTLRINFNGDTGTNYEDGGGYVASGSGSYTNFGIAALQDGGLVIGSNRGANRFSIYTLWIPGYDDSNYKTLSGTVNSPRSTTEIVASLMAGTWLSTAAINQLKISLASGSFLAGSSLTISGIP